MPVKFQIFTDHDQFRVLDSDKQREVLVKAFGESAMEGFPDKNLSCLHGVATETEVTGIDDPSSLNKGMLIGAALVLATTAAGALAGYLYHKYRKNKAVKKAN